MGDPAVPGCRNIRVWRVGNSICFWRTRTWLLCDGVPEPASIFEPRDGTAAAPIEGSLEGADAVAVTVDPPDSSTPRSEPLLTATL